MNKEQLNLIYMKLDDVYGYIQDTLAYLESDHKERYNVDEIIMYLGSCPENIEEIKNNLLECERMMMNEQL